jgi:hypothetical protein
MEIHKTTWKLTHENQMQQMLGRRLENTLKPASRDQSKEILRVYKLRAPINHRRAEISDLD